MYFGKSYLATLAAAAGISLFAGLAAAQAPAPVPFMTHQLKPNVYWVEGGGGNSGVIIGDKGVVVVDAKTTAAGGKELLEDIAKERGLGQPDIDLGHSQRRRSRERAGFISGGHHDHRSRE